MSKLTGGGRSRRRFLGDLGLSAAAMIVPGGGTEMRAEALAEMRGEASEQTTLDGPLVRSSSRRRELDLSGVWRFQIDGGMEGKKVGFFTPDFPRDHWREVSIPRAFDDCGPGLYKYRGTCWFSRQFEVPASIRGQRLALRFEGVNYNSSVWVNGKLVGENDDAFLPFEFPVEQLLKFGEKNLVVVCVDNIKRPVQLPTSEFWQGQGGILREVKLVVTDQVRMEHLAIAATPVDRNGKFALRSSVVNGRSQSAKLSLEVKVINVTGHPVAGFDAAPLPVEAGRAAEFSVEGEVANIVPWSPSQPRLYTPVIELLAEGIVVDGQEIQFGFRTIEARDAKLLLNGKQVFLMGFDRHEDSPRTGMAVDLENSRQDFLAIKDAGANFVRFCHYPHHPGELALCDELGLLVLAEIPLCGWGNEIPNPLSGAGWVPSDVPTILTNAERQLRKMIQRDRNHPSIIFWSVSNEAVETHPEVNRGNNRLIQLGRELDPTRLVTHVSSGTWWTADEAQKYFEVDDVICLNAYPATTIRRGRRPEDYSWMEEATQWWRTELARLQARFPGKPMLITEFGYTSIEGMEVGPLGEETQALATEAEFKGMDAPYVCGATLWVFAKHLWPAGCWGFDVSPWGYVSRDRRTKMKAFSTVRSMFKRRAGTS
jgi:beta-glucuronidase